MIGAPDRYIIGAPRTRNGHDPMARIVPGTVPYNRHTIGAPPVPDTTPRRFLDSIPPASQSWQFSPTCSIVFGRRNAGKTYFMTLHSLAQRRRLDYYGWRNVKIAANYWNQLAYDDGYVSQFIIDELTKFPPWGKDLCLYVDEVQGQALARRSMSAGAVNLSSFLTMIRKRDIDLMCSTQFPQTLDQQVLMQFDFTIEVASSWDKKFLRLWVCDFWGQYNAEPRRLKMPPFRHEADMVLTIQVPDPTEIFTKYNHKQVIAPRYLEESVRQALTEWEDEKYGSVERLPGAVQMGRTRPEIPDSEFTPEEDVERTSFEDRYQAMMRQANNDGDPFRMAWSRDFMLATLQATWGMSKGDALELVKNLNGNIVRRNGAEWVVRPPASGGV
jgi:hypothetical protein